MQWFSPTDDSAPVIQPGKHIQSKYPGREMPTLPPRAVVFCLGKGLPVLREGFAVSQTMEQLPGFIAHSPVRRLPTVTTDAPYRQTFWKEEQWRELGCAAVDMEASAVATVCTYYGMACTVALMVSDKHPVREGDPPWTWGSRSFPESRDRFIAQCAAFALGQKL